VKKEEKIELEKEYKEAIRIIDIVELVEKCSITLTKREK